MGDFHKNTALLRRLAAEAFPMPSVEDGVKTPSKAEFVGVMNSAWRPIETAPKDGTEFLAYDPVAKKYDVCEVSEFGVRPTQQDHEYGPMEGEFQGDRATLWMPLPAIYGAS